MGAVEAELQMWHGQPASAVLQLPPPGVLWLAPESYEEPVRSSSTVESVELTGASKTGTTARADHRAGD